MILRGFDAAKINAWLMHACTCNGVTELYPKIRWSVNHRFTSKMGLARYNTNEIELSGPLFARASEEDKRQTVIHEACHLIAYYRYFTMGTGHKQLWKETMRKCGVEALRCHNVDNSDLRRNTNRHASICSCGQTYSVSARVARKIQQLYVYRCAKCHGVIDLVK
jgi:predicted SprT family Zn-dependent metalloprotease